MSHPTPARPPETAPAPADPGTDEGRRRRHPRTARGIIAAGTTAVSALLLVAALLLPNRLDLLTPPAFLRLPAEGIVLAAVLLILPGRARRVTAVPAGAVVGVLTLLKCLDMGFYAVLQRPFDLVLDWTLLDDAADYLRESYGRTSEVLAIAGALLLAATVPAATVLALVRVAERMARRRPRAVRATLVLAVAWVTCATFGCQAGGAPVASTLDAQLLEDRVQAVRAGLADARVFAAEAAVDAFQNTPPDRLLTGLRGKDVLFTFVESYGRAAIEDPAMARQVGAVLQEGTASLGAAGFRARSGWLRSPVLGAGSWMCHATLLSGLWINNQQRYRDLVSGERTTLGKYFRRTGGWRTVGVVPGVRRAWPEARFFGLDRFYDSTHLGYHGPYFSWTPVPDQFTLEAFDRLEYGKRDRRPVMAEIILASSHQPWAPLPRMVDWHDLGDGSVFGPIRNAGKDPAEVWKDTESVRTEYRESIAYSLRSLFGFMGRHARRNTVLVFLGDHQPRPEVVAGSPRRDVPVTIVAHDPAVLDRVAGWGWTPGLRPAADAPIWAMDKFRDRFLTAFGPREAGAAQASRKAAVRRTNHSGSSSQG
ncbi:MAG: sulfatase [Streptomyces sp.]|uniref:sulfatase n=1 Tax=Streptomyces sp. TaxID=1931 RepID=UPI0025FDC5CD|nr:sulfatase [Streptomyces sp.]MBW8796109.1 sulfatase [Streptomyces sp.]